MQMVYTDPGGPRMVEEPPGSLDPKGFGPSDRVYLGKIRGE